MIDMMLFVYIMRQRRPPLVYKRGWRKCEGGGGGGIPILCPGDTKSSRVASCYHLYRILQTVTKTIMTGRGFVVLVRGG